MSWDESSFNAAWEEFEKEVTEILRGVTIIAWNSVLRKTPQYYGGMAASWTYCLNQMDWYNRSPLVDPEGGYPASKQKPFWAGHANAIRIANSFSAGKEQGFKLGDTVYFTNAADGGEGSYSQAVENGEIPLRLYNRPGAPVHRSIEQVQRMMLSLSPNRAKALREMKLGGLDGSEP